MHGEGGSGAEAAGELRTDMADIRETLADWPAGQETQHFTWTEVSIGPDGKLQSETKEGDLTKEEAQALLEELDTQLDTLREMTELQRIDLQNMTQDYNQALNTLSGILKSQQEYLKAIINNLKA